MSAQRLVMWVLCALVCLSICSHFTAGALFCPPCSEIPNCSDNEDLVKARDGCLGGVVSGSCGCCRVCAKVENESCGGPYGSEGLCDEHLRCTVSKELFLRGELNKTGICLRKSEIFSLLTQNYILLSSFVARAHLPRKRLPRCFLFVFSLILHHI